LADRQIVPVGSGRRIEAAGGWTSADTRTVGQWRIAMEIKIERMPSRPTACVRVHTDVAHIGEAFNTAVPKVAEHVARMGGALAGPPYTLYREWGASGGDIEVGFPTTAPIPHDGEVVPAELPEVQAAVATYVGPYEGLGEAYEELQRWIRSHGHEPDKAMWEVYLTDPGADPDTSHWRTQIVWPLKS
jgi:effector-binding domain-containing protein